MSEHANPSPRPSDDDDPSAAFEQISAELAAAVDAALPRWVESAVARLFNAWQQNVVDAAVSSDDAASSTDDVAASLARQAGARARQEVMVELRALLATDVDDQRTNPLSILRQAVAYPTAALAALGVPPVVRDDEAARQFPHDDYDLTPMSFRDLDESVHEPGLRWGAAKAFVVLDRRRAVRSPAPVVVAYAPDLMDRSKITGTIEGVRPVSSPDALAKALAEHGTTDLALVDLGRPGIIEVLAGADLANGPRVIGFASHVDDETIAAAKAIGCTDVLARSVFFRRLQTGEL